MPDRSVVVRLRAEIAAFKHAMGEAARAVRDVGRSGEDADEQTQGLIDRMRQSAEEHQQAWTDIGQTMLIAGGVIGAGVGLAVKSFADFDKEMSQVRAVSGASSEDMKKLSDAALQAGADTKFSASEAAQATGELAKVGISTSDILGGALTGSLNLAAAGNLDLAQAAEISGQAMKLFNLQGKDVPRIADALAAGANKSAADVTDLAQALSQGGLVAAQTGLTLEDTVGTLSAFADNALMGSDAGTSFKTMLQRLNPQSAQAQKLMDQLGLSAYDAQGNFVGITAYAGKLQTALGKMSVEQRNAAMQTLFGSDAVRAATVLYSLGADGVQEYVDAVKDQGAAAEVAAVNMDNLSGDVEQLRGSIETGLTQAGSGANDALRALVQTGTGVVNFVNNLPGPITQVGLGLGAVTSAALITGGAFTTLTAKAVATKATMVELGIVTEGTAAKMTTAAKGAGILAAAVVGVTAAGAGFDTFIGRQASGVNEAGQSLLDYAKAGREAKGVTDLTSHGFKDLDQSINLALRSGAWSATKEFFADFATLSIVPTGMDEAKEFFKEVDSGLSNLVQNGHADEAKRLFDEVAESAQKQGFTLAQVNDLLPSYAGALAVATSQQKPAAESASNVADAIAGVGEDTKAATDQLNDFDDALKALFDQTFSVEEATDAWHSSLNDLAQAVKDNGRSTKGNTDAAIANREALRTSAQKAYDLVQAYADQGHSSDEVAKKSRTLKDEFIKQAREAGFSKAAAEHYADALDEIPGTYTAVVGVDGATEARTKVSQLQRAINNLRDRTVNVTVVERGVRNKLAAMIAAGDDFADGGMINVGTGPRSDDVLVRASKGEFIVNAASTARHRPLLERLNSQKFADGGYVSALSGVRPVASFAPSASAFAPASVAAPEVAVFVQSPVDGKWVRAQARVEIGNYDRAQSRAVRSGVGRR